MKHNYDTVAWFYDRFSRLIFGGEQVNAQLYLLRAIPAGTDILIVGGGTGWVLEEIAKIHPSGLTITYVDASAKMVELAEKRNAGDNKVTFIAAPVEETVIDRRYDVVLTPFLFDNFTETGAKKLFSVIDEMLGPAGTWLYCDFQNTGLSMHKVILKMMYTFFRLCCGIKATGLPDVASYFTTHQYRNFAEKTFMKGFIVSCIYKRITPPQ